jgi:hypothetical protein
VTKDDIITKTLAEMNKDCGDVRGSEFGGQEGPNYEELVIATLKEQLPDNDDVDTCENFEGLKTQCCDICHRFYPHYDMYLVDLPIGGKAWLCCAIRAAFLHWHHVTLPEVDDSLAALGNCPAVMDPSHPTSSGRSLSVDFFGSAEPTSSPILPPPATMRNPHEAILKTPAHGGTTGPSNSTIRVQD